MNKVIISKTSYLALLLLVLQLFIPIASTMAATNSSILPPSNLAAQQVTPDDVKLTWSSVYGATGYNVYEIKEGQLLLLGKATTTSYNLNNLAEGSYRYVVSTLSVEGESGPCAPITVDIVYPDMAAPATLTYTMQNGNDIVLNWGASQYAQSYKIYEISAGGEKTVLTSVTSRTYTVSNASEGKHTYSISAVNSTYGESSLSTPVEVEVIYPMMIAPANFTYTVANGNDVTLKWDTVPYTTNYKIYQIIDGQPVLKNTITGNTVKFTNLPAGDYVYEIRSNSDRYGESVEAAKLNVTVSSITMATPSNFAYKIQNTNDIVLTWGSVPYATSYKIYQIADGEKVLKSTVTGTSVTYTKVPAGNHIYEVYSYSDRFGESAEGGKVSVNIEGVAMDAPANFTYTIQNLNDTALSWGSVSNATSYKVYQIIDGQKVLKSTVTGTSVTYTNMPAGDYVYEVFSFSDRFGESSEGSKVSITIEAITMTAPSNFAYKIQNGNDIVLSWESAENATNYKVYQIVNGQKVLKSTVAGTIVTYANMPAGEYKYEVYSFSSRFGESKEGNQVSFSLAHPTMKPPTNLVQKVNSDTEFVLNWETSSYATNYRIYQVIEGKKTLKSTVTGTTVTYTNMASGEYSYVVHSYSSRFGESVEGAQLTFTLSGKTMESPTDLSYTVKNGNDITLTWSAAQYGTGYKIYQVIDDQKVLKNTVTGTTITFSNLPAGNYKYVVHSVSSLYGESAEGAEVAIALVVPTLQPPGNFAYKVQNGNDVVLTWGVAEFANSYKVYELVNGEKVLKTTVSSLSTTITKVPAGEHNYVVHSVSTRFGESPDGSKISFNVVFPVLQAPGNLTYKIQNGNDVVLNWEAVEYANSYNVYELIDGEKVLKTTVTGLSATLINVLAGERTYVVHAVSSRFGEAADGSKVSFTMNEYNIQAPDNLTYKIQNGNDVVFTWGAVQYANSYKVYELIEQEKVLKTTVTGLSATLTNVSADDHTYVVHAVSTRYGESPEGSQVSFKMVFPMMQAPANSTYSITNGNDLTLKWDTALYATAYKLYQIINGQLVLQKTLTGTSVSFTNIPEGDYKYEVHAVSSRFGESQDGSQINLSMVFPTMQAPANPTYSITNGNDFTLRWNSATYATAYKVYQIIDGQRVLQKTLSGTAVTFTNMPERDYKYEIQSFSNRFGESTNGSALDFTLVWPVIEPPALTGTVFNANNITLSWKTVPWANEYRVYKITNGNRQQIYKGTALSQKIYNLTEDTHSFEVTAYNTRFGESKPSNPVTEKIVYPVMQPPVAVLKLLSDTSASIYWDFVTYANGYNVYEIIDGKQILLAEKVNNLSYTVSNLSYANHEYVVTSYSNSFGESEPSNTVLAKLIVDTEAPVTTTNVSTDWMNQNPLVTLTATDNETGVAHTYYSLNDSDFVEGTSFTAEGEGVHKVSFYSADKVGNKESIKTINIKVDQTAPVTETSEIPSVFTQPVILKLNSKDAHSGVSKTFYSINGSQFVEGTTLTVDKEGANQVSYYSVDQAGNVEQAQTIEVKIDKTAPVTASDISERWSKENVNVTLSATDKESGVAKTYYSMNGSEYVEGTSFTVDKEGVNQVSYYSVDQAGNVEQEQTIEVKIDKTAPITTSDVSERWSNENVMVKFSPTDKESGVAKTYYSINGSSYMEGTSFTLDKEGLNEVSFYSIDEAGNIEQAQTMKVKIDKTVPVTISDAPNTWSKDNVTVKLTAADEHSGVHKTLYSINGSAYVEGSVFSVENEGVNEVSFYSVDKAGNTERAQTVEVKIDKTAPVVSMNSNEEYKLGSSLSLLYSANDDLSGVVSEQMIVTGPNETAGKVVANGTSLSLDKPGVYNVTIIATNGAGLTTTIEKQFVVYIPATIEVTPKVIKGNNGVFTVRVDIPNGYNTQGFDLNTAKLNGVNALMSNHGYYNQAKNGQFKFERSDFTWTPSEVTVEFRGYLDGYLVVGQTTVKVQK
ncbi:hypothetical protein D0469_09645 [Peribacillus saganii]|uniref:Fibronectin type-III domain-containing protein n=1 Tax=Peribacillus saganii TaxID=2303992 RepID=A0A372LNQ5_9BACI|nr:hypothetical protein [Peribacillus saganii]RFU69332.1 hypothetical protein D0469_09645 [Peribacillus saganii]